MKVRVLAIAAVAAAAVAVAVAAPASAAVPTAPSGTLTIYNHQTQFNRLDLGANGPNVGDVATGSGTVALSKGGKVVGSFTYRAESVRVNIPGGNENLITTAVYTLPGGTIMTSGLVSAQQGTRPTKTEPVIIVGGTGDYIGASGTATLNPGKKSTYTVTFRFVS